MSPDKALGPERLVAISASPKPRAAPKDTAEHLIMIRELTKPFVAPSRLPQKAFANLNSSHYLNRKILFFSWPELPCGDAVSSPFPL